MKWTVAAAITLARLAHADKVGVTFDVSRPTSEGEGQGVYGWQFTANSNLQILSLGIYDNAGIYGGGFLGDGLVEPHVISIWDASLHLSPLISASTSLGTTNALVNGFRYVNVAPIVLTSGHDYVIAATYPNPDPINPYKDLTAGAVGDPSFTVGQAITFGGYRAIHDLSGLPVFPTIYQPGNLYGFGPNFTYAVIPEPSSFALCFIGGVLGGLRAIKCRRRPTHMQQPCDDALVDNRGSVAAGR